MKYPVLRMLMNALVDGAYEVCVGNVCQSGVITGSAMFAAQKEIIFCRHSKISCSGGRSPVLK
jgi:hypothetical protein